jgi:hypothetical protein
MNEEIKGMKKIYALALVLMTAAALTTACQKEEAASVAPVEQTAPVVQSGAADEQRLCLQLSFRQTRRLRL